MFGTVARIPLVIALSVVLLISGPALSVSGDPSSCIVKSSSRWGAPCDLCRVYKDGFRRDHEGTFLVELKNTCDMILEVKAAVQEENGVWRTFPVKALEPGGTMEAFACKGTGRYMYWVRHLDDRDVALPSDGWIMHRFHGK